MQRSTAPAIWQFDDFVNARTCTALSKIARDPKWMADRPNGAVDEKSYCVEVGVEDPLLVDLRGRIESLVGMESDICDTFRYRWYRKGEGHRPHLDCYTIEKRELLVTALLSLRTTTAGGETRFPLVDLSFPPVRGRLLVWCNYLPDGEVDPLSRHEGCPVLDGEKEVLLYFIYKRRRFAHIRPDADVVNLAKAG